jgi:hypothetical protein
MPKTTYLARLSVLSAEEEGRIAFIVSGGGGGGMDCLNEMK